MPSLPKTVSGATSEGLLDMIRQIKEWEKILGPLGGLGDWRPELRAFILEVGGQIRQNFNTHSSAGKPWEQVQPRTARRRTNALNRGTLAPLVDEGRPIPAVAAEAHRPGALRRPLRSVRGWRGLRDIASNTRQGAYPGLSLYRLAKQEMTIGVKSGPTAVPYARAHLRAYNTRPARNYMALPTWVKRDLLRELVEQGVQARLDGWADYRGAASGKRR